MNPIQWIQKGEPDVQWDDLVIRLRNIETMTGNSGWRSEQQFTASHVLIVVINGQGRLSLDRFECRLREAGVYLCPPNETFEAAADHSEDLKLLLLRFEVYQDKEQRNQDIKSNDKMQWLALKGEIPIQPSESLVSMCMELCGYWQCPYGLERFRSQAIFQELIYRILKNRIHRLDAQQTSLESAKEYLENHYNENLTILQLAHIAQISPKYFVDLFKKTYGTSAIDYLTELRIKRAKQLMSQAHLRLRDIASQVGYQDEFYFSRKFKKRVGISPSMYMKKRRRKVAAYRPSDIGQLLALNIIPYAAPLHPKWTPFYYNRYRDDIEVHLSAYRRNLHWESNIETIRKAQPDIIICTDPISDGEKERLERMPSLLYAPESAKDWREQLVRIAEFLGERPEAMQFLQSYQEKVKLTREQLNRRMKGARILLLRIHKHNLYIHCSRSIVEVLYHDLQLSSAYPQAAKEPISIGQLAEVDADCLLILVCQEPDTLAYWRGLQQSFEWQELRAVQSGQVHLLSSDPWLEYSASAHDRILTETLRLFSGDDPS